MLIDVTMDVDVLRDSHAALGVGRLMFPLFALALGLPETFFEDKVKVPVAR